MTKSRDAFRTISEVADWLATPAHVLRFWESKFSQVKPVKRAGGRRYYRPNDMLLLGGLKFLLHEEGMTIKGAQALLREKGIKHVVGLCPSIDAGEDAETTEIVEATQIPEPPGPAPETKPQDRAEPWELEREIDEGVEIAPEFQDHAPSEDAGAPQYVEPVGMPPTEDGAPQHFLRSAAKVIDEGVSTPKPEQPPMPSMQQAPAGPTRLDDLRIAIRQAGSDIAPDIIERLRQLSARMSDNTGV